MAKYSFSFDAERVTIVDDKTNKVDDKLALLEHVELSEAFRVLTKGRQADAKASDVAISMLVDALESPVLELYKGKTPANEKVPSTFNAALRDVENDIFKVAFVDAHKAKGASAGKADQLWQEFRKAELTTGSYSNAKSFVAKLFCHVGQTPVAPNGKLLPLYAVRRMYESWKQDQESSTVDKSVASRLVTLSSELHQAGSDIGDCPTAIAALKAMLATYETMYRVELEQKTNATAGATHADVSKVAAAAVRQAKGNKRTSTEALPTGDALTQALKDVEALI